MKKLALCLSLAFAALAAPPDSFGQQDKWYLPPYNYDMSTALPTPNPATSAFNTTSQSVADNNGNILFYIKDMEVLKSNGTVAFSLPESRYTASQYSVLYHNMLIVPVPSVCNKYYVLYSLFGNLGGTGLYSVIIDVSSGNPLVDSASLENSMFPLYTWNPKSIANTGAFAVSKPTSSGNERFLFAIKNSKMTKFSITSSGIAEIGPIYTLPSGNYYPIKVELSPDQKYLSYVPNSSDHILYQTELNGSYNAVTTASVNLGYPIKGIQYDPSSSYVFVSGANGIQWHTASALSTGAFTTISGTSALSTAALELSKTGNIYGVNNSRALCYFSTSAMPAPSLVTTNITINQGFYNFPGGNIFTLPMQIDGQDYSNFSPLPKPRADFSLAGATASDAPTAALARNAYTCNDILFGNTGTPYQYLLTVQSCDASGNVVTGTGYLNYSSGYRPFVAGFMDFKALPVGSSGTETWLADPAHFGYYKVTLVTRNACGEVATPKTSYLKLNAPPSAATINFRINNGLTGVPCNNKNISTACPTGIYSGSYNIGAPGTTFGSNNIASYSRKIEEVDCVSGNVLSTLYEDAAPVIPANPSGSSTGLAFNALQINGSTGYFATNPVIGKCYKFTLTAFNACSNSSDWSYFAFDGYYKPGKTTGVREKVAGDYALTVFPQPAGNILNFKLTLSSNAKVKIDVYDIQGHMLLSGKEETRTAGTQQLDINVSGLSAGIFLYKIYINNEVITGRISKL